MKNPESFIFILLLCFEPAFGGTFINLGFESADTNGSQLEFRFTPTKIGLYPFGTGSADRLLPGWHVYVGGHFTNTIAIGNGFYDSPGFQGIPPHAALYVAGSYALHQVGNIVGNYALILDNINSQITGDARVWVVQQGEVPTDAQLFTFRNLGGGAIGLVVNDRFISSDLVGRDPSDSTRALFDISPWAGQEVTLGFLAFGDGIYIVDDAMFLVPEPGTGLLSGAGLLVAALFLIDFCRHTVEKRKCSQTSG